MGIFSNKPTYSGVDIPVIEGYTFDNYGHYDIFMESLEDDQLILEAMYIYDMNDIETSRAVAEAAEKGDDEEEEAKENKKSVMEASAKEFFTRIKEAIKKFFGKVMAWFKNIIDRVRAMGMDADKFVSTYKARIEKARVPADGIKVQSFDWKTDKLFATQDIDEINSMYDGIGPDVLIEKAFNGNMTEDQIDKAIEETRENNTTTKIIGEILDIDDPSDSEINDKLYEIFRGDGAKNGKKEITIKSIRQFIPTLKGVSNVTKNLNKVKEKATAVTNKIMKAYDKAEKKAADEHADDELLSKKLNLCSASAQTYKSMEQAIIKLANSQIAAINEYVSFAKSVCLKGIKGVK